MELTGDQYKLYKQRIAKDKPIKVRHTTELTEYIYDMDGIIVQVLTAVGLEQGEIKAFTVREYLGYLKDTVYSGVELITAERARHAKLGYDAEHDRHETNGELAVAGALYALDGTYAHDIITGLLDGYLQDVSQETKDHYELWPWKDMEDKRGEIDRIRELTIAGALIAAEIDRLQNEGTENNVASS